ncbi:condensin complex subunit 1 [Rhinatrema bivittatum]|uniref:condensin complex subunit 1 n=1 Tax=Rhinatrema bivittatum TaxID=194408 RepID=UPI00112B7D95|nr:condensin complex subunit 1 [Rhinatrema bivittatum]XP_029436446.1 condensin complex subunit 1 [Rhinatrema bivittatum]XP_029436447.1 condensin complex subunit 1 [Rhinatrema bivittatum]
MAFDFHIPLSFDELLKSGGVNQYVVQEVLPAKQLSTQFGGLQSSFRIQGPLAILEHFDSLYSILHHFRTVDPGLKEDTMDLLVKAISRHSHELPAILEDPDFSPADRHSHLNALKMNCYLLTQLLEAFEAESYKLGLSVLPCGKGKKVKGQSSGFDWQVEREQVLQVLSRLLQLEIHRLWSRAMVEEEFVSMVSGSCYKILENQSVAHVKSRAVRDAVAHLLGVLVKRYNHMLSASLKISQLLQHFEHLAPILVQVVILWATEYGVKSIVGEIMREIGQKCPQELVRETSGVRAYTVFLTELAEKIPSVMLPSISVLLDHLDGESYVMRNAVLGVVTEIVIQVLSGEELEEMGRCTRDQFLDTLQEHVHDVNAFVRTRALQSFARIVQQKALPLNRFHAVVTLVVGRLFDKSVNVCKMAIQLLAAFLANNPFTCKLSSVDLKEPLEKETRKLKEMREQQRGSVPAALVSAEEEWAAMLPEIRGCLQTILRGNPEEEEDPGGGIAEEETAETASEHIALLLKKSNYKDAITLAQAAVAHFEGAKLFQSCMEEDQEGRLLGLLEKLFKGHADKEQSMRASECAREEPAGESPGVDCAAADTRRSQLLKQEMLVQYLRDAFNFAIRIEEALVVISKMISETAVSVVQEVIEFFVTVSQFGVSQAVVGIRKMLPLVWSKEAGVREAVVNAYKRLYLPPSSESSRLKAQTLVHSFSLLMVDSSLGTIQCLEEILSEFVQKDEIEPAVIQLLWERFTGKSACSALEQRAAVMLLGMLARGRPEIVGSNLDVLVTVGLGERVHEDYQLAREVCNTILKIADSQKSAARKNEAPFRLPKDHALFERLTDAVTEGVGRPELHWLSFAEKAVCLIYQLAEEPEGISAVILQRCSCRVQEQLSSQTQGSLEQRELAEITVPAAAAPSDLGPALPSFLLVHLLFLAGATALQQLVHLERSVGSELRRRRVMREEQDAKDVAGKKAKGNESTMEEELGLVGASADDIEAELIRKICDTEILEGQQCLSTFVPLLLKICSNPGRFSDPNLLTTAALALAKFMLISADFCDSHLRLLFTMLEKSPHPCLRSNIMIAVGDLSMRFPNMIEPWTPYLYARLRDPSRSVRKTASLVMTHLILKDLVKVKGQISEMAVLLNDPDEEIAGLARNFFHELANKGNAVYNLLPDIISRLSHSECGVGEDVFQRIMRQLLSYITKEKQTENLVEKLCQRFRTARSERQWRDLAHCLTLLPISERGLRKMQETFECFGDKLSEEGVYNSFTTVVGRMRRGAKPEFKALIDEFEQKIASCHDRGMENMEGPADLPLMRPSEKPRKKCVAGKRQPLSIVNGGSDGNFVTPRETQRKRPVRKQVMSFSSEEEEDEDLEAEMSESETPKNTTPIRRTSARTARRK